MHKALILPVCLYSLTALANSSEDACALGIQKLTPNTLTFFYTPKAKADQPYFYVKAMAAGENPVKTVAAVMATGETLPFFGNAIPPYYQVPEQAKKLYIVKATSKLTQADPLAQVTPELTEVAGLEDSGKRNASIFASPLPPETHTKVSRAEAVMICEYALDGKE
jgi:hypothetical protein